MASAEQAEQQPEQPQQPKAAMVRQVYQQTALVGGAFSPQTLEQAIEVAKLFAHSGMMPKSYDGNVGAVLVAVQMGAELGLSPMAAIQNIAVINGRPSLWGDAMLAVCMQHPKWGGIKEAGDAKGATCTVWRKGDAEPRSVTFTIEDARTAGLLNKDTYKAYPARMLQLRARAFALRDKFADALRGMASAEEQEDIIDAKFEAAPLTPGTHSFGFGGKAAAQPAANVEAPAAEEKPAEKKAATKVEPRNAAEAKFLSRQAEKAKAEMADEQPAPEPGSDG